MEKDRETMNENQVRSFGQLPELPPITELPEDGPKPIPAWELVDTGRYMPRRIRGSYRGRELG